MLCFPPLSLFFFFFLFIKVRSGNCSNKTPPTRIRSQSHPTLWHHAAGIQCEPPWLGAETLAFWAMRHPEGAAFSTLAASSAPFPQSLNLTKPSKATPRGRHSIALLHHPATSIAPSDLATDCAPESVASPPKHPDTHARLRNDSQRRLCHLKPRHDPPSGPGWQPPVSACVVASSTSTFSISCDNSVGSGIPPDGAGARRTRHDQHPRGGDRLAGASCASALLWTRKHWRARDTR